VASIREVLSEQLAANQSSAEERAAFASHRARLTELCLRGVSADAEPTLCVLGAGNANDLDLDSLARVYRAIHLVDLDSDALERAAARVTAATRERLVLRAPVDISGTLDRLERWASLQVTPEELGRHPLTTASNVNQKLGGPFSVVVSACVLTPLQLAVVSVLGDRHPLFEAIRYTVTLTHLYVLSRLTAPGGRALLVTDLTASDIAPDILGADDADLVHLIDPLVAKGQVFQVAQPALLREMAKDSLASELELPPPSEAWRWHNGARRTFLVYALEGRRTK